MRSIGRARSVRGRTFVSIALLALIAITTLPVSADAARPKGRITSGSAVHHDTSRKLRNIRPDRVATRRALAPGALPVPGRLVDRRDRVVQRRLGGVGGMPATILNFDGMSSTQIAPPDTNGEVGLTQYVQMTNAGLQMFSKATGATILGPVATSTLWAGFGGVCETGNRGDPIVVYDQLADRWVISQFNGTPVPDHFCVAVSTTSDATGAYHRYDFDLGSDFFDYPKLSVWPDAYYLAENVFSAASGNPFLGHQPFALDRAAMLTGAPATFVTPGLQSTALGTLLPGDLDGSILPPAGAPNPWLGTAGTTWTLFRFDPDFATPLNTTWTVGGTLSAAAYTTLSAGVPQLGTAWTLDPIGDRPMFRLAYRRFADGHEALVANKSVSSGGVAGIRWFEIANATSGTPTFTQQSTYQPDTTWRWMGSAAMDRDGNLALGFSASSATIYPEIRYAGRLATDPVGVLSQGEATLFAGTGSQLATNGLRPNGRWGDYSDMTIDPVDDCTFWYTNEYYATTSQFNWRTRIGSFKFPGCGAPAPDAGTLTPASHDFGSRETGTSSASFGFTFSNTGGSQLTGIAIDFAGANPGQFTIAGTTTCGSTLGVGDSCSIDVKHAPGNVGGHEATLRVASSDPGGADTSTLAGVGTAPPPGPGTGALTPAGHDFGSRETGTISPAFGFTFSNTGGSQLTGIAMDIIGPNPGQFSVSGTTCGGSLGVGDSCTIDVQHAPGAVGSQEATLRVASSDPGGADTSALAGVGTEPPARGTITIIQDSLPNKPRDFAYRDGLGDFVLDDDANPTQPRTRTFSGLAPGGYTVEQVQAPGWALISVACDTGELTDVWWHAAGIDLSPGENVSCTFTNALRRPDGLISRTSRFGGFIGNNILAATALATQTQSVTADATARTYTFWARVQNDSKATDRFIISATQTLSGGITVAYLVGGVDRTAAILAGTHQTSGRAPGAFASVVVKVTVPAGTDSAGATIDITSTSASAPTKTDVVRAVVTR